MGDELRTVTVVTADGHAGFLISVQEAEMIDAAFQKTGQDRLVWVTANPGIAGAVRLRLNIDQIVYIADK